MEGVLTPEIWIAVAEKTGIRELRRTTRDEPDYDKLMLGRLRLLDQHGSSSPTSSRSSAPSTPRRRSRVPRRAPVRKSKSLSSRTPSSNSRPTPPAPGLATLLCHRLVVENDRIVDYQLRVPDQKKRTVAALKLLNYHSSPPAIRSTTPPCSVRRTTDSSSVRRRMSRPNSPVQSGRNLRRSDGLDSGRDTVARHVTRTVPASS